MLKRKLRKAKLNNHGFSMVELLIAMAILGVVSLVIYSFMMQGSRFYGKQYADADIQSEAQLVANTITDLIVDCEVNISYDENISNSINPDNPSSSVVYAEGKALEISNSDYQFIIFHNDTNLYYLERRPSAANPSVYEAYNIENAELLAENITEFDVDLSRVSGKGKGKNIVTFSMTYESNGRSYSGNYQVNLRNDISVSGNALTPINDEASCTTVVVSPNPYYVDVRGKDNPVFYMENTNTVLIGKDFSANSDAVNVGRENIYQWTVKDKDDNIVDYATAAGATDEKVYEAIFNHADSVPSYIRIIATSTVPNKATGVYPSGEAIVYFKKLLGLAIVPTSGVTSDKVDPEGSAVFNANVTDYNMTSDDRKCSWKLEYRIGNGEYMLCTDSGIASGRLIGSSYSSKLGTNVASSYTVQLGSKATSNHTFRLTIQNQYDSTWTDVYEFGVTETEQIPGVNSASRGVEIDLASYFMSDAGNQYYTQSNFWHALDENYQIVDAYIENGVNYDKDSDLYAIIKRDGKFYMYLDFDAWNKPESILQYYDSHQVQMKITTEFVDGADHTACCNNTRGSKCTWQQTINWYTEAVTLSSAKPLANSSIVIPKGGSYDASCSVTGYNLSKKNMLGIYFRDGNTSNWNNANSNEIGMLDMNKYIAVDYTGTLGNRYVLIQKGAFRLTAKSTTADYPTSPIQMMVTLDNMYRLAMTKNSSEYINRSSYTYNVYVANVEGTGIYVQGPPDNNDITNWYVNVGGSQQQVTLDKNITITSPSEVTVKFEAEKTNDIVSYYKMTINGQTYYWNSTYHCWKPISQ